MLVFVEDGAVVEVVVLDDELFSFSYSGVLVLPKIINNTTATINKNNDKNVIKFDFFILLPL